MGSLPFISVVIATFNRARMLPGLIAALDAQTYPRGSFEIIFVDDGSSDETLVYLKGVARDGLFIVSGGHGGVSRARNLGVENAHGDLIAFTDDDCIPEPGWLAALAEAWAQHGPNTAYLGHTFSEHPSSTFIHSVFKDSEPAVMCNFAVSRRVFNAIGGFDINFFWGFEDEDLGLRIRKSGVPIIYLPAMRVFHPSRYQSFYGFLRLRRGFQYFYYMTRKHPEGDHWYRHRGMVRQIWKKAGLVGLPLAAGLLWPPALIVLAGILILYVVRDAALALRYRRELRERGFHLRGVDMIAFSLLNWAVPFIDAGRIVQGFVQSHIDRRFSPKRSHV